MSTMTRQGATPTRHTAIAPAAGFSARLDVPSVSQVAPVRAILPNGRQIIATHGVHDVRHAPEETRPGRILLWDPRHQRLLRAITTTAVSRAVDLTALPDGRLLVAALGGDGHLRAWDGLAGRRLWRRSGGPATGLAMATLPDGRAIVATSIAYGVRVRDACTGERLYDLDGLSQRVPAIAATTVSDGRVLLAAASGARVWVWDAATAQMLHDLPGHRVPVIALALHPMGDGTALLAAATALKVRVWDPIEGSLRHTFTCRLEPPHGGVGHPALAFADSRDGRTLLAYSPVDSGDVWLWDAGTGTELAGIPVTGHEPTYGVTLLRPTAPSDVAAVAAVATGADVLLWPLVEAPAHATTALASALAVQPASVDADPVAVSALAIVPGAGGRPLLARAGGNTVWVSELNPSRPLHRIETGDADVDALGWVRADDGRALLSAATGTHVYWWDPASGREVDRRDWHGPPRLAGLAVGGESIANQVIVLVRSLDRVAVWDVRGDHLIRDLPVRPRTARSLATVPGPDGRLLLAAGSYDGAVQLWDVDTGELLRTLVPHLAPVKAVALAVRDDDSVVVLSGDDAGAIRVWDADTGALLAVRPEVGGPVAALACQAQPDGGLLVAASVGAGEHTLLRWSAHPAVPAQRITAAQRGLTAT